MGWGRLSGKYRRSSPIDASARAVQNGASAPHVSDAVFYNVIDVLDAIAGETGKTVPQIALNWVLGRPAVATVIIGARNEAQLRDNLGALGWSLSPDQLARLDGISRLPKPYPHWHQHGFHRNPSPV